ncbi:MAG: aspartate aminotransferase family protein [Candidatus Eremiobacteraeota bacterium]|nr:aspartate aminotransferase family protein [Candidatus Eremiobacteraeota bacterium]
MTPDGAPEPSDDLARIVTEPPGPLSRRLAAQLRDVESRNVTYLGSGGPIFLASGQGATLSDVDGNRYVDLCGAFGVAAAGHANPAVSAALADASRTLLHGMGDVYPTQAKVLLAQQLCALTPGDGSKRVIFATSGAEAVEAALKTAAIATGKAGVLCFGGAYHGLTYGALAVSDRDHFRKPFLRQLGSFATRVPYADPRTCSASEACPPCDCSCLDTVRSALEEPAGQDIGALIVEPAQGRGGELFPPDDWLRGLRTICDDRGLLLIADEIYTGFGRTGRWFACEHAGIVPDLICVGKGLSSGFPISACVGSAEVMDRWPESTGEAIHTSTFLGSPAGCAAALASIGQICEHRLVERADSLGRPLGEMLHQLRARRLESVGDVRGRGLMWGVECVDSAGAPSGEIAARALRRALKLGVIALAGGPQANVISISPPLCISLNQIAFAVGVLDEALSEPPLNARACR